MADIGKPMMDSGTGKVDTNHAVDNMPKFPGKPGSPEYIKAVKTHLSLGLNGDQLGEDSNGDGKYKGKGLGFEDGGRAKMLQDRITMELVGKSYDFQTASKLAKMKVGANYQQQLKMKQQQTQQSKQPYTKPQMTEQKPQPK